MSAVTVSVSGSANQGYKEAPLGTVLTLSVLFHALLLIGFPLLTTLVWKPAQYGRPKTFELVRPTAQEIRQASVKALKKAFQKKPPTKPIPSRRFAPKQELEKKVVENTDELESVLNELPAPVQVSESEGKYNPYIEMIIAKVEKYWVPPTQNQHLSAEVSFVVTRDGNAENIHISRSSGISSLDNLAIRAVTIAAPFGRLPPSFTEDRLSLNMTLYSFIRN